MLLVTSMDMSSGTDESFSASMKMHLDYDDSLLIKLRKKSFHFSPNNDVEIFSRRPIR